MSFIRKRSSDTGKIDISPMLDIVFILLIFFWTLPASSIALRMESV